MTQAYRTQPEQTTGMPSGVPYIVVNEAAERFSYYGMRTILFVFMTKHLLGFDGHLDVMSEDEALPRYHFFLAMVYLFPLVGALISDVWLGKYRTIIYLSLVYCLGHVALAADETRVGLAIGLALIAIGSGGIKPCVSANVGDQFGPANQHLVERVFGWFYLAVNLGAAISAWITPILLVTYGPHVAFGVPGVLMFVATLVFWLGRHRYVHVPPAGIAFLREATSGARITHGGPTVDAVSLRGRILVPLRPDELEMDAQAGRLNLDVPLLGRIEPAQTHVMNPVLILILVPLFTYVVYPGLGRLFALTPLRKIAIGFFLTAAAFALLAVIERWSVDAEQRIADRVRLIPSVERPTAKDKQRFADDKQQIEDDERPSIGWQAIAYVIITSAEVMVSVTCLEYSYTQAPRTMKSLIMALNALSVFLGNMLTTVVSHAILTPDGKSRFDGPDYYWLFAGIMLAAAVLFVGTSWAYLSRQTETRVEPG